MWRGVRERIRTAVRSGTIALLGRGSAGAQARRILALVERYVAAFAPLIERIDDAVDRAMAACDAGDREAAWVALDASGDMADQVCSDLRSLGTDLRAAGAPEPAAAAVERLGDAACGWHQAWSEAEPWHRADCRSVREAADAWGAAKRAFPGLVR